METIITIIKKQIIVKWGGNINNTTNGNSSPIATIQILANINFFLKTKIAPTMDAIIINDRDKNQESKSIKAGPIQISVRKNNIEQDLYRNAIFFVEVFTRASSYKLYI